MVNKQLNKFGEFLVANLLDKGVERYNSLSNNQLKSPSTASLQAELQEQDSKQLALIKRVVNEVLFTATHDFLCALQERNDLEEDIEVLVVGANMVENCDGLNGKIFGENGWISRFSKYSSEFDL